MGAGARAALLAESTGAGAGAFVTGALEGVAEAVRAEIDVGSTGFTGAGSGLVGASREHAAKKGQTTHTHQRITTRGRAKAFRRSQRRTRIPGRRSRIRHRANLGSRRFELNANRYRIAGAELVFRSAAQNIHALLQLRTNRLRRERIAQGLIENT
jgi:hypothetical protein